MSLRLSPSLAKVLLQKSPKHAYLEATKPREQFNPRSVAMRFGAAVDRLVFDIGDEITVKLRRGQRELPGQILLTEQELERATNVACAVKASQAIPGLLAVADKSSTLQLQSKLAWVDKELDIELVCKPDAMDTSNRTVYDLKTTRDISGEAIARDVEKYGYDIQAAAYLDAVAQALNWDNPKFAFVFAETSIPYDTRMVIPDLGMVSRGMELWHQAKRIWKQCLESNNWPGYGPVTVSNTSKTTRNDWLNK